MAAALFTQNIVTGTLLPPIQRKQNVRYLTITILRRLVSRAPHLLQIGLDKEGQYVVYIQRRNVKIDREILHLTEL